MQRDNPSLIDEWALDYGGPPSTGLAVTTTAVPEPGACTLLLSGVLASLVRRQARRS